MAKRKIVEIDQDKCDGCGECVPSCAEGAIEIAQGKARLVSDVYCDGLGACLGQCPHGAISVIEREAAPFDEALAQRHAAPDGPRDSMAAGPSPSQALACPGTAVRPLAPGAPGAGQLPLVQAGAAAAAGPGAALGHWPVQLHLVPPGAPFLRDADLMLVADCVPVAMPDFHARLLRGRPVVIACPKLDDTRPYVDKLARMIVEAPLRSLTVVHMEVPCCTGLRRLAEAALAASGRALPLASRVVTVRGELTPGP